MKKIYFCTMEEKNINITYEELFFKVCRILTRALKEKQLYPLFVISVGNVTYPRKPSAAKSLLNALNSFLKARTSVGWHSLENIFFACQSFEDMVTQLAYNPKECIPQDKIQQTMMEMVNQIIHSCLESTMEPNTVATFGKEVFENVGKDVFGDDFVDETENAPLDSIKAYKLYGVDTSRDTKVFGTDFIKNFENYIKYIQSNPYFSTTSTLYTDTTNCGDITTVTNTYIN